MPEKEVDALEYSHATCQEVHPRGTVHKYDVFKALCGVNSICMGYTPNMQNCPECIEFFQKFHTGEIECPLCHKKFRDHVK